MGELGSEKGPSSNPFLDYGIPVLMKFQVVTWA